MIVRCLDASQATPGNLTVGELYKVSEVTGYNGMLYQLGKYQYFKDRFEIVSADEASDIKTITLEAAIDKISSHLSKAPEYTGGSVSYYKVDITSPTSGGEPYMAECNDIIEALQLNYAEGNAFKAIWRSAAARVLGKSKKGYTDGLYDAQKVVFFGERMVAQAKQKL